MAHRYFHAVLIMLALTEAAFCQTHWERTAFPGPHRQDHAITVSPTGDVVASGDKGTYLSIDDGDSWQQILHKLGYDPLALARNSAGTTYAAILDNGGPPTSRLLRSTDNGVTWGETGLPRDYYNGIAFDSHGRILVSASQVGLFRSGNDGAEWTTLWATGPSYIQSIAVDETGTIYADVSRSTNDGGTWEGMNGLLPAEMIPAGAYPYSYDPFVADLDAHSSGQVYALVDASGPDGYDFGGQIMRSTDNGASWNKIAHFQDKRITCLAVDPVGDLLVGVVPGGVLRSSDSGRSWISTGLESDVHSIAVSPTGVIYAGTSDGVWRTTRSGPISPTSGIALENPARFALEQNYPNPFNPSTSIQYTVAGIGDRAQGSAR